jgi:hypothetical protein
MTSRFTFEQFVNNQYTFTYDTQKYPFKEVLYKIFNNWDKPIEELHQFFENSDKLDQITIDEDTKTRFHRQYYDSPYYPEFLELYYTFVKEQVLPLFNTSDTEFIVQKDPCFRICLPNNTALGKRTIVEEGNDRIGMHTDGEYGHPSNEVNFMVSFGYQRDSNSCYVETGINSNEFKPIEMNYGEFYSFYGNKLRHYNKTNLTGQSRVSIDFRVIPMSYYDESNQNISLHGKRPFILGGYYVKLSRNKKE